MRGGTTADSIDASVPLAVLLLSLLGGAGAIAGLLYWLMQPTVLPNPGLAAYDPPRSAQVVPVARLMNAPAITQPLEEITTASTSEPARQSEVTKPVRQATSALRNRKRTLDPEPRDWRASSRHQWAGFGPSPFWDR